MRFSQRIGAVSAKLDLEVDSVSDALRNSFWNLAYIFYFQSASRGTDWRHTEMYVRAQRLYLHFLKTPIDEIPDYGFEFNNYIKKYFRTEKWYNVYDLFEWIANWAGEEANSKFQDGANKVLETELSGYRFVKGKLAAISNKEELDEIENTFSTGNHSISSHITSAIELLSSRTTPSYRNSIKESISAVEAAARLISGNPNATLGDALNQLDKAHPLHSALKEGLKKIYGWSSDADGIRHAMMDVPNLTQADARFMLVACSAFANYLIDRTK